MVSKTASEDENAKSRAVVGKALAALVAAQANWGVLSEVHGAEREVIETWAAKAKIDLEKPTVKARTRLLDVANNALMNVALGSSHPKSEDKLGTLGLLNPRLFEVEIENPLKANLSDHGLTKSEIGQAIHYPDAYQHLSPPLDFNPDVDLVSIFVRVLNPTEVAQGERPEWVLIIGGRKGRKVNVRDGYRIAAHTLKDPGKTPLELFRSFCEVYGCELILGGKKLGKLLMYERLKGTGTIEALHVTGHKIHLSTMARIAGDTIELAFGYAIDLTSYTSLIARS